MTAPAPQLRVARPTRDIDAIMRFYTKALELEVLARFDDHAGFDGIVLGRAGWQYHLEFTRHRTHPVEPRPTDEDLLVLYLPQRGEWGATVQRLLVCGAKPVRSSNPYWEENGVTLEDPDGYRIVVQNSAWP